LRGQKFDECFEAVFVEGGNISQARNHGTNVAEGELIAFLDSDCIAEPTWLTTIRSHYIALSNVGGVGGVGLSPLNGGYLSDGIGAVYQTYLGSLGSTSLTKTSEIKQVNSLSSHNSLYHRETLEKVLGFNEAYQLNEDTDLSLRIRSLGYDLYFVPDSIVYHKRKKTLKGFAEKFYTWGQSRTRSMLTDQRHIDLRVMAVLGIFILGLLNLFKWPVYSLTVFLLYLTVLMIQSIASTIRNRDVRLLFIMPVLFILQHTSYAIGMLSGFTKGKYRKNKAPPEFRVHREKINTLPTE
jgi:GT2 family glycosyltransferase